MSIDTAHFRALLLEERERVERAIENLREDKGGRMDEEVVELGTAVDNHLADTATATLDREIDYSLEENSGRLLVEIDAALKRIEDGTYGKCTACGREISPERLEAFPWASLCIDDARQAERT